MSTQEKQELLETIASLPEANKSYVYGYAAGVMDAIKSQTAADTPETDPDQPEA